MDTIDAIIAQAQAQVLERPLLGRAAEKILASRQRHVDDNPRWDSVLSRFRSNPAAFLSRLVVEALPPRTSKLALLLSGGEDSAFLLDVVRTELPEVEVVAYTAATRNNGDDVGRARKLCDRLGVEINIISPDRPALIAEAERFLESTGRLPHDPAQPLHNHICRRILLENPHVPILDGQFADTVLQSNPHNLVLENYLGAKLLSPTLRFLASVIPSGDSRPLRRVRTALELLGSDTLEAFILRSCRFPVQPAEVAMIKTVCERLNPQASLSAFFFWTMIEARERDKYLVLEAPIVTPFDDEQLFWLCAESPAVLVNRRLRKLPIHNHMKERHPDLYSKQNTLPFEAY